MFTIFCYLIFLARLSKHFRVLDKLTKYKKKSINFFISTTWEKNRSFQASLKIKRNYVRKL